MSFMELPGSISPLFTCSLISPFCSIYLLLSGPLVPLTYNKLPSRLNKPSRNVLTWKVPCSIVTSVRSLKFSGLFIVQCAKSVSPSSLGIHWLLDLVSAPQTNSSHGLSFSVCLLHNFLPFQPFSTSQITA